VPILGPYGHIKQSAKKREKKVLTATGKPESVLIVATDGSAKHKPIKQNIIMKTYQIASYINGLESLRNRVNIAFDDNTSEREAVLMIRRSMANLTPESVEQAQVRDANGYPLTPVLSLERI